MRRTAILLVFLTAIALTAAVAYVQVPAVQQAVASLLGKPAPDTPPKAGRGAQPAIEVVTAVAGQQDFPVTEHAIGFIQSPSVVNISARVSSQIEAVHVKDGQEVKKGDLLFTLDDRSLQAAVASARAALARDQAALVSAEANALRAQDLVKKQAGTQQAADEAVAAQDAAKASIDLDQAAIDAAQIQLGYARITAPISGRLGAIAVVAGNLVSTGGSNSTASTLVTITQMDPLEVAFSLPESELPLLRKAMDGAAPAMVRVFGKGGGDVPLGTGTLDFINSSVDQASGTIAVKADLPNGDHALWPGQYVDVSLDVGTLPAATTVPSQAVQVGQQGPFVYVVKTDGTIELRPVSVALTAGDTTAIGSGLKPGEAVVTDGQMRLKNGVKVVASAPASATAPPAAKSDGAATASEAPRS
jgi:multidrug efflux system membrane fusion protein